MGLARLDDYVVDLEVSGAVPSGPLAKSAPQISDGVSGAARLPHRQFRIQIP
jgi:hypothetical protein